MEAGENKSKTRYSNMTEILKQLDIDLDFTDVENLELSEDIEKLIVNK